jgi:NAD(P)-dependent dehydrogenase (short-subunit alcohol dehydrogenase family)
MYFSAKDGSARALQVAGGALIGVAVGAAAAGLTLRRRFSFAGRTVIVTGGSRGLGLVMARQLAAEGANLVLLARDSEELARAEAELVLKDVRVLALPCDVSERGQVEQAVQQAVGEFGGIDVLINNAGIIQVGPLEHMEVADFEEAMAVHFFGPLYLTLAVLPLMRAAGGGRIVNISSIGGKIAAPHLVPYSASKFALVGLSDGLRAELRAENILVTTVCPGLMRTGSPPNAKFKGRFRKEYAWFTISDSLPLLSTSAEWAARRILNACRRGSPQLLLGAHTKAAVFLHTVFPGTTAQVASFMHRLLPKPGVHGATAAREGWESESGWAPSWLTALTYRAAERNNERPHPRDSRRAKS